MEIAKGIHRIQCNFNPNRLEIDLLLAMMRGPSP